jgi:hypothetical protein
MAETNPTDDALGRALRAVGRDVAYPPSPSFAPAVVARLEAERAARTRPRFPALALWSRRRVLVAVGIALLGLLALAFAARLVLGAAEIRVRPGTTPSGPPIGPGALGRPVSVEEARAGVEFPLRLPAGQAPDEAYVFGTGSGNAALLAWTAGEAYGPRLPGTPWGLILVEVRGERDLLVKDVNRIEDTSVVAVDGRRAFWIDATHELIVLTDAGAVMFRVDGNVLIWTEGDVTLRMETSLPLTEAVALAESVR